MAAGTAFDGVGTGTYSRQQRAPRLQAVREASQSSLSAFSLL